MAGRRPKPAAMHRLNGNPSMLRKVELDGSENPQPQNVAPEMPKGMMKAARREWRRMVPMLLGLGVLTEVDGLALAAYCRAHAAVEHLEKELDEHGWTFRSHFESKDGEIVDGDMKPNPAASMYFNAMKVMKSFLIEFGLTPAARRNVKMAKHDEADPMSQFLSRQRPGGSNSGPAPALLTPVSPAEMTAGGDDEVVTPDGKDSPTD